MSASEEQTSSIQEQEKLRARASENRSITGWVLGFWVVAVIGYVIWLKLSYDLRSDLNCRAPGTDSTYGQSTWQWLPPGEVCSYPGTEFPTEYPSSARAGIGAVLIVVPLVVLPLWIWSEARIRDRLRSAS